MRAFESKKTIVYGGSSGIGLATALLLKERGADVTIASDIPVRGDLRPSIGDLGWIHCDVRDAAAVQACTEQVAAAGAIDYLVYCAGIQRYGRVEETSIETWDLVQSVNARGLFLAAHFAVPRMRAGGSIVCVSSVQSTACQTGVAAYAASKGSIDALSRAMAVDLAAQGIRVNAVLPGTIDTPMVRQTAEKMRSQRSSDEIVARWGSSHPIGRVAEPREVAQVIAFLLSDEASFVTGSSYRVDGGLLASLPVRLED